MSEIKKYAIDKIMIKSKIHIDEYTYKQMDTIIGALEDAYAKGHETGWEDEMEDAQEERASSRMTFDAALEARRTPEAKAYVKTHLEDFAELDAERHKLAEYMEASQAITNEYDAPTKVICFPEDYENAAKILSSDNKYRFATKEEVAKATAKALEQYDQALSNLAKNGWLDNDTE